MPVARSLAHAGKTLTLPHANHNGGGARQIRFDAEGRATVTDEQAQALVQFFPKEVEVKGVKNVLPEFVAPVSPNPPKQRPKPAFVAPVGPQDESKEEEVN